MGMGAAILADAICMTTDQSVMQTLKGILRGKGVSNVVAASTLAETEDALKRFPNALLVVHWMKGSEKDAALALFSSQGENCLDLRPVLLIVPELNTQIVATAMEFNVTQMQVGDVDSVHLAQKIGTVLRTVGPAKQMKLLFRKIDKFREDKDFEAARQMIDEALQANPKNLRLRTELAEIMLLEGDYQGCMAALDPLMSLSPPYLRALTIRARCLSRSGDLKGAAQLLNQAKIFNPHHLDRLCDLGEIYFQNNQISEAEENFGEALKIDPNSRNAKIGMGKCLLMEEHVNQALEMVREIANPSELASMFNLAAVMTIRKGAFDQGMRLYESALKAIGKSSGLAARLMFNKGVGYRRMQNEKDAMECFKESLKLDPKFEKARVSMQRRVPEESKQPSQEFREESLLATPTLGDEYDSLNDDFILGGGFEDDIAS